jgi:hypothetical protein
MAERQAFIDRVKVAERESLVVVDAIARYREAAVAGTTQMPRGTSPRDVVAAAEQVESTYLIRMWAEFESALRSYRRSVTGHRQDRMQTRNLIDWTAGVKRSPQSRSISADVRDGVHEVREYRNSLVHERDDQASPPAVAIGEARKRLNTLLHSLPFEW